MTVENLGDGDIRVFENIVFPESSTTDTYTIVINTNQPSGNSTVINDDLDKCFLKIKNLIDAEINNESKDYDLDFIRQHVNKLTS